MLIKPCEGRITSPFGMRTHPTTGKPSTMHWGVDYGNTPNNNAIVAAADGKVVRSRNAETDGYGKLVIVEHILKGVLYTTVYAHLSSILVKEGATVKRGQRIATKGTTGNSTGIHLHFEVHQGKWNNKYTNVKNPLHYVVDPDVKKLQSLLVKAGYKLVVDGIQGPATDDAVKAFQKANKLTVDGIAGKVTIAALEKTVSQPKKERKLLKLNKSQREELAGVYAYAKEKKVFASGDHEKDVLGGKMTHDKAIFLNGLIAGAALNGGKRIQRK